MSSIASRARAGVATSMSCASAASFTGLGAVPLPRPRRRSGWVTTSGMSKPAASSASNGTTAASGVPKKTTLTPLPPLALRAGPLGPHSAHAAWEASFVGPRSQAPDVVDPLEPGRAQVHVTQLAQRPLALVGVEPVEHEHAVQMVELVEEHPAEELVALDHHLVAVEIEAGHGHDLRAHDLEVEPGDGQAPLLVDPLPRRLGDLGVDEHLGSLADVEGEHALLHPDLGRGQADPRRLVHRVDHRVDEA